jgi:hypothetical protein
MTIDILNKKKCFSEMQIDVKNKVNIEFNEKSVYANNYTMQYLKYDSDHGKSVYSDEGNVRELPYDPDEDESIQELKNKLIDKMRTFY